MNDQFLVTEDPEPFLTDYASIPSRVVVSEVLDIVGGASNLTDIALIHRKVENPHFKDYDAPPCIHPREWGEHFDLTHWGFLKGTIRTQVAARAAIAWRSPGIDLLEARADVALLWDIRVAPELQRRGFGTILFLAVEQWARDRGAVRLKVETQNINVAACAFYARQGCVLGSVNRGSYPGLPDEIQLLWDKRLNDEGTV